MRYAGHCSDLGNRVCMSVWCLFFFKNNWRVKFSWHIFGCYEDTKYKIRCFLLLKTYFHRRAPRLMFRKEGKSEATAINLSIRSEFDGGVKREFGSHRLLTFRDSKETSASFLCSNKQSCATACIMFQFSVLFIWAQFYQIGSLSWIQDKPHLLPPKPLYQTTFQDKLDLSGASLAGL